jgi:hypothetical protein
VGIAPEMENNSNMAVVFAQQNTLKLKVYQPA